MAAAGLLIAALPGAAGVVTGVIALTNTTRAGSAAEHGPRDYSGVVLSLVPINGTIPLTARRERMLQKGKMFTPHVLPVEVGSVVDFPNLDPIFHNAFSNFNGQIFDIGLYPPGKTKSVVFRKPGAVRVFCNIHPSMSAVIVVVDTPYFAVTDRSGAFRIPDVAAGRYRVEVFHERATEETLASLTTEVDVNANGMVLPAMTISEAGYIPISHMNKFGKPYPHAAGETGAYEIP